MCVMQHTSKAARIFKIPCSVSLALGGSYHTDICVSFVFSDKVSHSVL